MISSSTCQFLDSVDLGASDFEFSAIECVTTSDLINSTTTAPTLGFFNPTTTISTSTDVQLYAFFTAGDLVISVLLLLVIALLVFRGMALSLSPIKVKRKFLQYGGGDVEIREDN
jgi:hypothetical protein